MYEGKGAWAAYWSFKRPLASCFNATYLLIFVTLDKCLVKQGIFLTEVPWNLNAWILPFYIKIWRDLISSAFC